jgi:histone-binding protein RBBP4
LMIAKVKLPKHEDIEDTTEFTIMRNKDKEKNSRANSLQIETKILHDGDVNRATYMPQKYNIIATKTNTGDVLIFDYTKHPTEPAANDKVEYQLKLTGHTDCGFGLNWNPNTSGQLLSGSDDGNICIWNINEA